MRIEEDLVDQLFNCSEKRLARVLLATGSLRKRRQTGVSQEMLAEMIGTPRSRVSFFMNKFRRMGFIDYNFPSVCSARWRCAWETPPPQLCAPPRWRLAFAECFPLSTGAHIRRCRPPRIRDWQAAVPARAPHTTRRSPPKVGRLERRSATLRVLGLVSRFGRCSYTTTSFGLGLLTHAARQ